MKPVTQASFKHPLWPDALWDVSGAFAKDDILFHFHDYCRDRLGFRPYACVHGSPLFLWNSGRVRAEMLHGETEIRRALEGYVKRGISVDLTFTNLLLKEEHMKNPLGNRLLEWFASHCHSGMRHAVIIGSDALYDHVKRHYPQLRTVSSILRITQDGGKGKLDAYLALAERYDKVMIHPDDTWNFDLLERLPDKDKYELIINEYCMRNCPMRPFHYSTLSHLSLDFFGHDTSAFDKAISRNGCSNPRGQLADPALDVAALSTPEIARLYHMGFRRFKLQGRGNPNGGLLLTDLLRLVIGDDDESDTRRQRIGVDFLESFTPNVLQS